MNKRFGNWLAGMGFATLMALLLAGSARADEVAPSDRILVLVSLDGFRWDYLDKFKAQTPRLNQLAANGVRMERLIPAFPSLTFPNHYTIVTGLYPAHHGIVNNRMYDPNFKETFALYNNPGPTDGKWWGGEPIWATVIKQKRFADCMFWPGSEASIGGIRPTTWTNYNAQISPDDCVATGLSWLAKTNQRPSLVTLYFHEVDTASHHNGVESPQVKSAVSQVDEAIGRLADGITNLHLDKIVNVIVVADHGMTDLSTNRVIALSDYVDPDLVQIDATGAIAGLRPLKGSVDDLYSEFAGKENHFHVYRAENMPPQYHYTGNARIPPVVLVADDGWYINRGPLQSGRHFESATHGYDPAVTNMGALFIAAGPAYKRGVVIPPEENVNIYNLLCATLGLTPAPNDGDDRLVQQVLAK